MDDQEVEALTHLVDRIFPPDDLGPGARDVGADAFVRDRLRRRPGAEARVRAAIADLDRWARAACSTPFRRLGPALQDRGIEQALHGWLDGGQSTAAVIGELIDLTIQGVFSDPVHGGNRNEAGWSMLGTITRPSVRPATTPVPQMRSTP